MLTRAGIVASVLALTTAAGPLFAEDKNVSVDERIRALEDTVAKQAEVIKQLQGKEQESWLNSKRAEEVRSLIQEVLADADTRASLLLDGMAAGYNDRGFFIGSPDGNFMMNIGAEFQFRYIYNNRSDDGDDLNGEVDENVSGFDLPRTEMYFGGLAHDIRYNFRIARDFIDDNVYFKEAHASKNLSDDWSLTFGGFRSNFTYEEQIESTNQLAAERTLVNELFTDDHILGLALSYRPKEGPLDATFAIHNGARSFAYDESNGFDNSSDIAVTGRLDYRLTGGRDTWADFSHWSGEATRIRLGGGVGYDIKETGNDDPNDKVLKYTVDASIEWNRFSAFAAYYGANFDAEEGDDDRDLTGFVLQGSYMLVPDKVEAFARYEYADLDEGSSGTLEEDEINILTAGVNLYCNRHYSKLTADVIYSFDPIPSTTELGLRDGYLSLWGLQPDDGDEDGQFALRLQYQLSF